MAKIITKIQTVSRPVTKLLTLVLSMSLTQYLSVADNARDAVLFHVSASSERQEQRN